MSKVERISQMHIFRYLKDWLRPSETSPTEASVHDSPASSFVSVSHPTDQEEPEVQSIVTDLIRLSAEFSGRTDLRPCEDVNNLFVELVRLCTRTVSERVVTEVRGRLLPQMVKKLTGNRS